jgi:hypothetical protein
MLGFYGYLGGENLSEDGQMERVSKLLREAVQAVEEAGVPEDLRVAAFQQAFTTILGPTEAPERPPAARNASTTDGTESDRVGTLASRLGLDSATVEDVYYVDNDELGLSMAPSRFDARKAPGTKQIALLVAAGRQGGGWEEWTPLRTIRETVRDYGRLDQANFATTIKNMGHAFNLRGRGHQVEVRVTRPGFEQAAQLIGDMTEA